MTNLQHLADQYIAVWNETDPAARRKLIDEVWAEDGVYTDPLVAAEGRDAFDAAVAAVRGQFQDLVFTLGAGGVDAHHHIARFTWELGTAGAEAVVIGFDVLVATEDGRIGAVHGFLDKVPGV